MGSQALKPPPAPQHDAPPAATCRAAPPYLRLIASLMSESATLHPSFHIRNSEYDARIPRNDVYVKAHMIYTAIMAKIRADLPLDVLFRALADTTRLRLLNLIADREICVCYFVEILKQSQPKISRHLAYLRKAGIVSARRQGKWMHYSIERPEDARAASILDATLKSLKTESTMQADLEKLGRACCEPQRFVSLQSAPVPARRV